MADNDDFPWDIGIHDAHCHPTDIMASIANLPRMKAATLTVMSTREEDQDLVKQTAESLNKQPNDVHAQRILPSFGWHPWFAHKILIDTEPAKSQAGSSGSSAESPTQPQDATTNDDILSQKKAHYEAVLTPSVSEDEEFLDSLPTPIPLSQLIAETKQRLELFPNALVGEIGLDKSIRLPAPWTQEDLDKRDTEYTPGSREGRKLSPYKVKLEHQKAIFKAQLQLAGEMQRPVSVHSVQAHGAILDVFNSLWSGHERVFLSRRARERRQDAEGALSEEDEDENDTSKKESTSEETKLPFPPRICMHSYSGPVDPIRQFMHKKNPSDVYFSFSSLINFSGMGSRKAIDALMMLPADRVLIESDLHKAGPDMDGLLESVARQVCKVRGWELREGVQQLADNYKRFVFG